MKPVQLKKCNAILQEPVMLWVHTVVLVQVIFIMLPLFQVCCQICISIHTHTHTHTHTFYT